MSIFSVLFNKKKPFTKEIGKTVVKINCTEDQHRLFNEMYECGVDLVRNLKNRISALESTVHNLNVDLSTLLGGDLGRIATAANDLVEIERKKLDAEYKQRLVEFEKTQKNLSEDEKEEFFTRMFLLLKTDIEKRCPSGNQIWDDDTQKIYNDLRQKHGLTPVERVRQGLWGPVVTDYKKSDENTKSKNKKRGKKNGKKPGRNRKAKAAGSGDAVSPDKKLANGQG